MTRRRTLAATLLALLPTTLATPAIADPVLVVARLAAQETGGAKPAPAPTGKAPAQPTGSLVEITGAPTQIALPDLLQATVRHSPALATARVDIEVAEATVQEAQGVDDWTLGASIVGSWTEGQEQDYQLFGSNRLPVGVERDYGLSGSVDLTRALSTGGIVGIHADSLFGRSTGTQADILTGEISEFERDVYSQELSIDATQPLLRGRGNHVARAAIAQARIARDAASLDQRRVAIDQVRSVVQAYWDLVFALRDLEIRRSSLELARERLRLTQAGINGGKVAPSEALAVEQVIATREEEILGAELTVLNQSVSLRRTAGLEIAPGQLALTTTTELAVPQRTWDLAALSAEAQRTSPELAVLATQEKGATLNVEVAENGLLPRLDLGASLATGVIRDELGESLKDSAALDRVTAIVSLTYEQALGRTAAEGSSRRARAERQRIKVTAVDVQFQINEAIATSVALVRSAELRVSLGARAVALAEQNITVEQSRFNLGKSTNFDVLLRQDELKQAQLRQARALVDWHKAQTVIQSLTGDLLETYGITLDQRDAR